MLEARQQQWKSILQITEQLHQLSADESWQAVTELESERLGQLQKFFSTAVDKTEVNEIEEGIREMLKSDELLMQLITSQQQNISDVVKKISTGKKAIKAYGIFQK